MKKQDVAVNANIHGGLMMHNKFNEFAKISARICASLEGLVNAQSLLVELLCKECDVPVEMKEMLITDMNKAIGVRTL